MLFISSSEEKSLPAVLQAVKEKPILTIGDTEGVARKGGIVNLVRRDDSVGFEINSEAGKRAGLTISSKLLRPSNPERSIPKVRRR
jgi:hypothetical protein